MAETTKRAINTEQFLEGNEWSRPVVLEAMKILEAEFSPISDARSGAEFRKKVAKNLLLKFYVDTAQS
jgi:xanthine dehydrogenase small subunit